MEDTYVLKKDLKHIKMSADVAKKTFTKTLVDKGRRTGYYYIDPDDLYCFDDKEMQDRIDNEFF